MSERENLCLRLPVLVERRLGDRGAATGCAERCPYRMPLSRALVTVDWCSLFREDIPDSGKERTVDCMAAGLAAGDDPHVVQERR